MDKYEREELTTVTRAPADALPGDTPKNDFARKRAQYGLGSDTGDEGGTAEEIPDVPPHRPAQEGGRATPAELRNIPVEQIVEGVRHRKEMGEIAALAKSVRELGLLQPPIVVKEYLGASTYSLKLVAGARRLAAVRELGWQCVDVLVASNLADALALLRAERDENTCRKDFTPSEAVSIGVALEKLEREQARARQQASRPAKGQKVGAAQGGGNFPPPSGGAGKTRDKVAEAVGMSGRTYEKAKRVKKAAEADPTLKPVVEEMDRTGKVDPAYQKVTRPREETSPPKKSDTPPPDLAKRWWSWLRPYATELGSIQEQFKRLKTARVADRKPEMVQEVARRLRQMADEIERRTLGGPKAPEPGDSCP
jgi:ParB family chromosome partitioning protein